MVWYGYGADKRSAHWDGHAWNGQWTKDDTVDAPQPWHHRFLVFLRHRWFWYMVIGSVLVLGPSILTATTENKHVALLTLVGMAVSMAGAFVLVDQHERFRGLSGLRPLVLWGFASGVVAIVLALIIEPTLEPQLGLPFAADLWLSGPIEETCKLLVPFLLLVFGSKVFKDPRAGLMLVLISGMVFGAWEAAGYIGDPQGWNPLMMGLVRPVSELLHPFLTGFAAAVIWLAAWRAGKPVTAIGAGAWLTAMAIHSLQDGLASSAVKGTTESLPTMGTVSKALEAAGPTFTLSLVIATVLFLLLRHSSRELVPPDAIDANPPHWRPHLKHWGLSASDRKNAERVYNEPA